MKFASILIAALGGVAIADECLRRIHIETNCVQYQSHNNAKLELLSENGRVARGLISERPEPIRATMTPIALTQREALVLPAEAANAEATAAAAAAAAADRGISRQPEAGAGAAAAATSRLEASISSQRQQQPHGSRHQLAARA
ncbi:hypothetical protein MY8738_001728 [Beauveria namnaoensis]